MHDGLFWWLVFPWLVAAGLLYLGILIAGIGVIRVGRKSAAPSRKALYVTAGALLILSPILFHLGADMIAQRMADARQAQFAAMERASLAGRLPHKFIVVGNFRPELIDFIRMRYRMSRYSGTENERLVAAYRAYRRAERCHRQFPGEMTPGTKIPKCKPLPDSIQSALGLGEPLLVFVEGRDTSMREDNVIAGEIYEIRLVTPREDLLVDYYEERTVKGAASIFMPFMPPRRRDADAPAPTLKAFIETAMENASR